MSGAATEGTVVEVPLVVDLDGTLVLTDLLHESAVLAVTRAPIAALRALPALFRGDRAALKRRLAEAGPVDAGSLPLREELVGLLSEARAKGRRLVLATAADSCRRSVRTRVPSRSTTSGTSTTVPSVAAPLTMRRGYRRAAGTGSAVTSPSARAA